MEEMASIYAYVETLLRIQFAGNAHPQRAKKSKSMRFVKLFPACETRTTKRSGDPVGRCETCTILARVRAAV
jgi:aerobic-type carbon monoxide dehydrogenase small subunit (CoxS/CutS family)